MAATTLPRIAQELKRTDPVDARVLCLFAARAQRLGEAPCQSRLQLLGELAVLPTMVSWI